MPDWLFDTKVISLVVGVIVLSGGGYFVFGSGFLSGFAADEVYKQTTALYQEFQSASQAGRQSSEFKAYYQKFQDEQLRMYQALGTPSLESNAYKAKRALQLLGSVVEGFHEPQFSEKTRQKFVKSLESQLAELKPIYGT